MIGSLIDIIQERLIGVFHLQINQRSPHRPVVVQTFATENHVPAQFADAIPSSILHSLVILLLKEVQISFIEYEIHILKDIVIVLLITGFICQLHQGNMSHPIGIMPVIVLASHPDIHIQRQVLH